MASIVRTTFQLKRGTSEKWIELNLVLAAGEPGFEIDTGRLKIGNGQTPWINLPYVGEESIVNAPTKQDFPIPGASDILYKAEAEKLLYQWNSTTQAYEILGMGNAAEVDTELSENSNNAIANKAVAKALKDLEVKVEANAHHYEFSDEFIVEDDEGIQTVKLNMDAILAAIPEFDTSNLVTHEQLQKQLPKKVSELENDAGYLTEHQSLDNYVQREELNEFVTVNTMNQLVAFEKASSVRRKYEVMPHEGIIVEYRDSEIRINTQRVQPQQQTPGANGSPNQYYIEFRAYAPEGANCFKEWEKDNRDETLHYFDESFAGIDAYGRKYSQAWMSVANYDGTNWNIYGNLSTTDKYLGFYYNYEWYTDDKLIGMDKIRIILTNDSCHNDLVEDAVARRIEEKVGAMGDELKTHLETNYVTVEQAVTKEELSEEVKTHIEDVLDNKVAEGTAIANTVIYGSF